MMAVFAIPECWLCLREKVVREFESAGKGSVSIVGEEA